MEIVKSLDINKRYNRVQNGSIVMAKNMRVTDDLSGLEIDEGFTDILNNLGGIEGHIVGVIECVKEIVLFTYDSSENNSYIYRLKDLDTSYELVYCNTAWHYSNGIINGTYTYNVLGELIITFGEYADNILIPLKIINLDTSSQTDDETSYNSAPNVPIANISLTDTVNICPIPIGIYYFFIRYKIDKNDYTNWFPIGIPYSVANIENYDIFNHSYKHTDNSVRNNYINQLKRPINNINKDSISNNVYTVTLVNNIYTECQIGYILQHDNSTVARIYRDFDITIDSQINISTFTFIFDGKYLSETSVDDLIENVLPLYNVHCVTSFENRTYIANYIEDNLNINDTSLINCANNIDVTPNKGSNIPMFGEEGISNLSDFDSATNTYSFKDVRTGTIDTRVSDYASFGVTYNPFSSGNAIYTTTGSPSDGQNALASVLNKTIGSNLYFYNLNNNYNDFNSSQVDDTILFGVANNTFFSNNYLNFYGAGSNPICYIAFPPYSNSAYFDIYIHVSFDRNVPSSLTDNPISLSSNESYNADLMLGISPSINVTESSYTYSKRVHSINAGAYTVIAFSMNVGQDNGVTFKIREINVRSIEKVKLYDASIDEGGGSVKNNFYFTTNKDSKSYSLYDLLKNTQASTWLFDTDLSSTVTTTSKIIFDDGESFDISNVFVNLDNNISSNLRVIEGKTVSLGVLDDGSTYFYRNSKIKIRINSNTYTSIEYAWGDTVIQNVTPVYTNSNLAAYSLGSFDPEEGYTFYIHFVKANGFYTNGYEINQKLTPRREYGLFRYTVTFTNINIPSGYVGYFISYVQTTANRCYTGYAMPGRNTNGQFGGSRANASNYSQGGSIYKDIEIKATEVEIGLSSYKGSKFIFEKHDGSGNNSNLQNVDILNTNIYLGNIYPLTYLRENCIDLVASNQVTNPTNIVSVFSDTSNNTIKHNGLLTPLGPILPSTTHVFNTTSYDVNYPVYITQDIIFYYAYRILFSDTEVHPKIITHDSGTFGPAATTVDRNVLKFSYINNEYLHKVYINKYCKYDLSLLSIKKEPFRYMFADTEDANIYWAGCYVRPQDTQDLYTYSNQYIKNNYKVYNKYDVNKTYLSHFTKSIRRSNVLGEESMLNSSRLFSTNQYKIISSNKGDITALVSLGTSLLIHTKHTLFNLSKQAILSADQKAIDITAGDLFDVTPEEVFTSNHGYGGLQVENNWCVNEHGYFFYDRDNHKIFNLDNNQLNDLSEPIFKYLDSIYPVNVSFNTDFNHNRVFICFQELSEDNKNLVTYSYNTITKTFISIHDFQFGLRCNTKNKVFFIDKLSNNTSKIFTFDNIEDRSYKDLTSFARHFPVFLDNRYYSEEEIDWTDESIETILNTENTSAIIDVIFNSNYPIIKSLESIYYDLTIPTPYNDFSYKMFADRSKYSGNFMQIYSDSCDTNILDIEQDTNRDVNQYNDYKRPYYQKGSWFTNYFRNTFAKELTESQLEALLEKYGLDENSSRFSEDIPYFLNTHNTDAFRPSDERSIIYGKYIVIRFIFTYTEDNQIKLENIEPKINNY